MRKDRTHYSKEFKIKAVELSKERGSTRIVAQELNIARESLRRWVQEYESGKYLPEGNAAKIKSIEEEEVKRLRKELYEVKLERDILKKAVSIFSKSDR